MIFRVIVEGRMFLFARVVQILSHKTVSDRMTVVSKMSEMIGFEEILELNKSKSKRSGYEYKGPPPLIIKIDL